MDWLNQHRQIIQERFYLRILLSHVRGPTSFEYLKEFEGVTHQTFQEACLARGLIEDDKEWINCMTEACTYRTARQLRNLFVLILIRCSPTEPAKLWEKFKENMAEDYALKMDQNLAEDYAYLEVERLMNSEDCSLLSLPKMPALPQLNLDAIEKINPEQHAQLFKDMYETMNGAQKVFY